MIGDNPSGEFENSSLKQFLNLGLGIIFGFIGLNYFLFNLSGLDWWKSSTINSSQARILKNDGLGCVLSSRIWLLKPDSQVLSGY